MNKKNTPFSRIFVLFLVSTLWVSCRTVNEQMATNSPVTVTTTSLPIATETVESIPTAAAIPSPSPSSSATALPELLPTETSAPTLTPTPGFSTELDMGWLFFHVFVSWGWYELTARDTPDGLIFDEQDGYHEYVSREFIEMVGDTRIHQLSHYSNQMVFVPLSRPDEFWLSDITYREPKLLLSGGFERVVWSPDDLHLFLYDNAIPEESLAYDVITGTVTEWVWECDSIILSPQTGRLATLCPRMADVFTEQKAYAVLEWGGEIWFADTLPVEPFLQPTADGLALWEWSFNGEWLAFFDPDAPEGHLWLADAFGNRHSLFPGMSVFNEPEPQDLTYLPPRERIFVWARSAPVLLVKGYGQTENPCPPYFTSFHPDIDVPIWPCWQAVNIVTGEIIWNEGSLPPNLPPLGQEIPPRMDIDSSTMTVSPNARAAAMHLFNPHRIIIVDLQTGRVTDVAWNPAKNLYWTTVLPETP